MNVVFLDIDGILTTFAEWKVKYFDDLYEFNPEALENFNKFTASRNFSIVVSSAWRAKHGPEDLREMFRKRNALCYDRIIDVTGRMKTRSYEIQHWIDTHKGIKNFLIFEDEQKFPPYLEGYTVRTSLHTGFTKQHLDQALRMTELWF